MPLTCYPNRNPSRSQCLSPCRSKSCILCFILSTSFAFAATLIPLLLFVPGVAIAASSTHKFKVVIDPGHGGSDTGASRGGLKESEIALKVGLQLSHLLSRDTRFEVAMTRTQDHRLTLSQRTVMADRVGADLFVSIHLNSSPDSRARGTEIYFQNQLPADEEAMFLVSRESDEGEGAPEALAGRDSSAGGTDSLSSRQDLKRILDDLKRNHRIERSSELSKTLLQSLQPFMAIMSAGTAGRSGTRAIRQAPFWVVSEIKIPAVLVELGFLTHPEEGPRLATADYQRDLAQGLYDGLVKFKEMLDKAPSAPLH